MPTAGPHEIAPLREGAAWMAAVPCTIAIEHVAGRPIIPPRDMLLGQRSDPASPAVNQAPALNQQTKETW